MASWIEIMKDALKYCPMVVEAYVASWIEMYEAPD